MKRSLNAEVERAPDLDERPRFSVVILYEDADTGKSAKRFYDRVIRRLEDECDFSLELWNLQMITIPQMEESITRAAARATLVILSFRGEVELGREFRVWIERWAELIIDADPALVALIATCKRRNEMIDSTLAHLRSVATRHGISLFVHTPFPDAPALPQFY